MTELHERKCEPCTGATPPLSEESVRDYLIKLQGWKLIEGKEILKVYKFESPDTALNFVYEIGKAANEQDHHPDATWSYKKVTVTFSTHAIKALSENDFIMAAKFDKIYKEKSYG